MYRTGLGVLVMALVASANACGTTSPTPVGYSGEWSGTTAQGRPLAFSVTNEMVTSITVGHDFNGCSGSQTFPDLHISTAPDVRCIPGPCTPAVSSYRAFGYSSGSFIDGPSTSVNGLFLSARTAQGTVNFNNFPGCGAAIGVGWTATRR